MLVVIDFDGINIFQGFLKEDDLTCKSSFHRGFELLNGRACFNACLVQPQFPLLKLLNTSIHFQQRSMCIFKQDFFHVNRKFYIIHYILACFGHNMTKTKLVRNISSYKWAHVTTKDNIVARVLRLAPLCLMQWITLCVSWN